MVNDPQGPARVEVSNNRTVWQLKVGDYVLSQFDPFPDTLERMEAMALEINAAISRTHVPVEEIERLKRDNESVFHQMEYSLDEQIAALSESLSSLRKVAEEMAKTFQAALDYDQQAGALEVIEAAQKAIADFDAWREGNHDSPTENKPLTSPEGKL